MNGDKSGMYEVLAFGVVATLIGCGVWGVAAWAEDRFGETGSIAVGIIGIIIVVVALVLVIGMLFAKIYRAGTVDATKLQQIAQQGDVAQLREAARALRPELTLQARNAGAFERDVLNWANKKAALMVRDQAQLPGPVGDSATVDADADWYELRAACGITYDE